MPGKRRFLAHLATGAGLGASGLLGSIQRVLAAGLTPVAPGVYRVEGDARINGQAAQPGMPVQAGDTVETDAGAEIVFVIGQDAYLQREKTVVQFGAAAAAAVATDLAADFLRVVTGKLLAVFGKGSKSIRAPNATIGIRGTGCYLEVEAARTYFCLCYGGVEIRANAAPEQVLSYRTTHHDRPYYIGNDPAALMAPARVINHSDAELTLLESLCGRRPPFFGQTGSYY